MRSYTTAQARREHPTWFEADGFFGTELVREWPCQAGVVFVATATPPHRDRTWNVHYLGSVDRRPPVRDTFGPTIDVGLPRDVVQLVAQEVANAIWHGVLNPRDKADIRCRACELEIAAFDAEGITPPRSRPAGVATWDWSTDLDEDVFGICSAHVVDVVLANHNLAKEATG